MRNVAPRRRRGLLLAAASFGLLATSHAHAATTANWLTATSGNWTDATKWSTSPNYPNNGNPSGATYTAVIDALGTAYTVSIDSNIALDEIRLNSLNATVLHKEVTFSGNITVDAGLYRARRTTLRRSTISGGGQVQVDGTTLDGVTLANVGTVLPGTDAARITHGLTLAGGELRLAASDSYPKLNFGNETQTLSGTGEIVFIEGASTGGAYGVLQAPTGASRLTIEPGVVIRTGARSGNIYGNILNRGIIAARTSGQSITINGPGFTNDGVLEASGGGQLFLINATGGIGSVVLSGAVSQLVATGNYTVNTNINVPLGSTLSLAGTWNNTAAINVDNGTLNLGGTFTLANVGTINRNGGSVNITGTLANSGTTLELNAGTGSWGLVEAQYFGQTPMIDGGTIRCADGAMLLIPRGPGALLRGVALDNATVQVKGRLEATNGLSLLNSTISIDGGSLAVPLTASGPSISGTGEIVFDGLSGSIGPYATNTITLGPGITVRTGLGSGTIWSPGISIDNRGTVSARAGQKITASGGFPVINNGVMEAITGGTLTLDTPWSNLGTFRIDNGILQLGRTFVPSAIGTLQRNGGTLEIIGTLNNAGATFSLASALGSVLLSGTISGGSVITSGGHQLLVNTGTPTIDSTSLGSSLETIINGPGTLTLMGTWTNAGIIRVNQGTLALASGSTSSLGTIIKGPAGTVSITGILSNASSTLNLNTDTGSWLLASTGRINGGTVATSGGSALLCAGGTLSGVTVTSGAGETGVVNSNSSSKFDAVTLGTRLQNHNLTALTVTNGLTFQAGGSVSIGNGSSSQTSLLFSGSQTLGGAGEIVFNGSNGSIRPSSASTLTIGPGVTIRTGTGNGTVGGNGLGLINHGVISAQTLSQIISVAGNINSGGTMEARNGGRLSVPSATLTNYAAGTLTGGAWAAYAGSTLTMTSANIANNLADIILSGAGSTFNAVNPLAENAGSFSILAGRDFTTAGALSNTGKLVAGVGSDLSITGNLSTSAAAALAVELGDDLTNEGYGQFAITGTANLAGTLDIMIAIGHALQAGDTFTLLTASSVNGTFGNVVLPPGAAGNVVYSPTTVTFTLTAVPVPEPGAFAGVIAGAGLFLRRRRVLAKN